MLFKNKKVLGLDIGTSTIKLAEMNVSGGSATLESFSYLPTPSHSVSTGELTDVASIAGAVQQLVVDVKTKRKNVCTGMWGTAVIVKKVSVPRADLKFIGDQLTFYAEQYIPFDINNISLSHHVLKTSGNSESADILLVAAQNELITQYSQVVTSAGLNCSILDVSGFALANCFEMNYGKGGRDNIGLINFGAAVSNFVIIQEGEVVFCRDIPVGGLNYTNEISKTMGITLPEAESLKLSAIAGGAVPEDVQSIMSATNELITEEIRNSLDFISQTSGAVGLNRLMYTGGSAMTTGLVEAVQRVIGVRTEPFNPFNKVRFNAKKLNPDYLSQISPFVSIAMGLGMRSEGDV
jgi:type IV pilus assembly protein PilM